MPFKGLTKKSWQPGCRRKYLKTKECRKCSVVQPIENFIIVSGGIGKIGCRLVVGVRRKHHCKTCCNKSSAEWRKNNATAMKKHQANRDKSKHRAARLVSRNKRLDHYKSAKRDWYANNRDKVAEYGHKNAGRLLAKTREYQLKKTHGSPIWGNKKAIIELYIKAKRLGLHVDHIIPVTHHLVCGLHVIDNLQLLTQDANLRKHNKFIVE